MAKRIDIGRGFAAVLNHPEPGLIVSLMARGIVKAAGQPMPSALLIQAAKGIGCVKLAASNLEPPEKFQKWFDDYPRRCAAACEDITGLPWIEIEFAADVDRAEAEILPRINAAAAKRHTIKTIKGDMNKGAAQNL